MRSCLVLPVAAAVVALSAGPALADPPAPPLPPLPAALGSQLTTAESSTLAQLTAGSGVGVDALVQTPTGAQVVTLDAGTRSDAGQAVALLDAQPGVTAGITAPVRALGTTDAATTDPVRWDIARVNGTGGAAIVPAAARSTVTVAVLDTGIAPHPLLSAALVPGQNFSDSDPGNPTDTVDRFGHGTHVAGTVAAAVGTVRGVAPGVRLMPVKVLDDAGAGTTAWIASGIAWATDHGADVITMSIGGSGDDPAMQSAIDYARSHGVVVVAAVGNYAQQGNYLSYPGADQGVVGVAATDSANGWASFSEYGPQVDIAAPGVGVLSTYLGGSYTSLSGTSMATPHVAGAAALVKAVDRALTPDQVQGILQQTAHDLGAPGRDDYFGYGELDAYAAVQAADAAAGVTPPVDRAPLPVTDTATVPVVAGTASPVTIDVLANDGDPDGDPLILTGVGSGAEGTTQVTADQLVAYYPVAGAQGTDSFSYTIGDGRGATATGTVYLSFSTTLAPQPPAGVNAVPGPATVTVGWSPVTGATGYHVIRDGSLVATTGSVGWTDAGLTPGVVHTYAVTTLSSAGESIPSVSVSAAALDLSSTDIGRLYQQLGGASGVLGAVTVPEHAITGGSEADYANGLIVQASLTAPQAVTGGIAGGYVRLGGATGRLGFPVLPATSGLRGGGASQLFRNGTIYWSPTTGAHALTGAIAGRYPALGAENSYLGYPTGDTFGPLRGGGLGQAFQGGSIYWSPTTGAHTVTGALRDKWAATGWENGLLGYPTGDAFGPLRDGGFGQAFQGGSIYWSPATGAHTVTGALRDKWAAGAYEVGMGYPTTDAIGPLCGGGFAQHFQAASIYWSPATGAHTLVSVMRAQYAAGGWENGVLGYPTSDAFGPLRGSGWGQQFQGGSIYFSPASGTHTVTGALRAAYGSTGWENGRLGYAVSEVYPVRGGLAQNFQGGTITWKQATHRTSVVYRR